MEEWRRGGGEEGEWRVQRGFEHGTDSPLTPINTQQTTNLHRLPQSFTPAPPTHTPSASPSGPQQRSARLTAPPRRRAGERGIRCTTAGRPQGTPASQCTCTARPCPRPPRPAAALGPARGCRCRSSAGTCPPRRPTRTQRATAPGRARAGAPGAPAAGAGPAARGTAGGTAPGRGRRRPATRAPTALS